MKKKKITQVFESANNIILNKLIHKELIKSYVTVI